MPQTYPETEGFAFAFGRSELSVNDRIFTAISNVSIDQPTESEAVKGMSPTPISQTEGTMDLGEGTLTFSDDRERMDFLGTLEDAYRTKFFTVSYVLRNTTAGTEKQIKCIGCRVTSNPFDHSEGAAALGGDIGFKFIKHTINGKEPH